MRFLIIVLLAFMVGCTSSVEDGIVKDVTQISGVDPAVINHTDKITGYDFKNVDFGKIDEIRNSVDRNFGDMPVYEKKLEVLETYSTKGWTWENSEREVYLAVKYPLNEDLINVDIYIEITEK
ncbi:MAG: hypothetical protein ACK5KP_04510 [Paludibacteraceae bacterium]